jgi:hypothetical protein
MKINRNNYAKECSQISNEIDELKNKLLMNKNDERILDSGLTTNSKFYYEIIEFKPLEKSNETKIIIKIDDQGSELEINDINVKRIMTL